MIFFIIIHARFRAAPTYGVHLKHPTSQTLFDITRFAFRLFDANLYSVSRAADIAFGDISKRRRNLNGDNMLNITRTDAARLIESIRELVDGCVEDTRTGHAHGVVSAYRIQEMLEKAGIPPLTLCTGEAHKNIHIDNCASCAPRWGMVGEKVRIR